MEPTKTAYGTWSGGRFMHFGLCLSEERYIAAIHHAYEQGIRTFMTADVYGSGDSDEILGRALADFPRDSYCLIGAIGHDFYKGERAGSKGFPRFTDPAMHAPEQWPDYVKTSTQKSLERIGVDKFDLLLLHNPDQSGFSDQRVWDAMATAKSDGLTELIGVAPGPANGFTLDTIQCFEKFGADYLDWAMIILNPFEPWPGQLLLDAAEKHGVKLITRVVDYGGIFPRRHQTRPPLPRARPPQVPRPRLGRGRLRKTRKGSPHHRSPRTNTHPILRRLEPQPPSRPQRRPHHDPGTRQRGKTHRAEDRRACRLCPKSNSPQPNSNRSPRSATTKAACY